jgi:multicomponent Na+:H+ antiporter subunit B
LKAVTGVLLAAFFGVLVWASSHLAPVGDPDAPLHREISPAGTPVAGAHYIHEAYRDAHTENMVTVVLADYRAFDTLGETVVVFAAGVGVFLVLARRKA